MCALRGLPGAVPAVTVPGWPEAVGREVTRHLEEAWPLEGCGVILWHAATGTHRVRPLRNAAAHPRTAYAFAPGEWLAVLTEADARGERVVCVFHSHVEAPAVFSAEDRARAAPAGAPLLPGVSYLIGSVHRGCVGWVSEYEWTDGDFRTRQV